MNHGFLFSILLFFVPIISTSQPILILDSDEKKFIGKYMSILEDPTGNLAINDILNSKNQFIPNNKRVFTSSHAGSTFWLTFQVQKAEDIEYLLVIDNAFINQIDIYSELDKKVVHLFKGGNNLPFDDRSVKRNNFVLPINLVKGKTTTIYIRYFSTWRMEMPISFQTYYKAIEASAIRDLWYGLFYGIMLMAIVYNLFIFLQVKYIGYLFYIGMIISFAIFRSLSHGISFQFIFPNHPEYNNFLTYLCYPLIAICIIHFTVVFLNTKVNTPRLHKGLYVFDAIFVLSFIISFFNKSLWSILANFILFIFPVYLMVIGFMLVRNGYSPAKNYITGTFFYLITVVLAAFKNYGLIPYSFAVFNFGDLGITMIAIFYSLALGERYNLIEREKKNTQQAYNQELKANIEDRKVQEEELDKLNQNLRNTNTDLDSFIYTASHDLKVPITNIEGILNLIKIEKYNKEEILQFVDMMRTSVSDFEDTVIDLQYVAKIQRTHEKDIELINLEELINKVKQDLDRSIIESNAIIETQFHDCKSIHFSITNLTTIVEELISNAIKFRSKDRRLIIHLKMEVQKLFCVLIVSDNGMGIHKESQTKIFSLFKRAHAHVEGKGLGLYIIKRIVENAGGKIEVDSEVDKGTTFKVYFRK